VYRAFEPLLESALDAAIADGHLRVTQRPACRLEPPEDPAFGDATSRVAMTIARRVGRPASEVGQTLAERVVDRRGWVERVEAGGPGFVNIRASLGFWRAALAARLACQTDAVPAAGRAIVLCAVRPDETTASRAALVGSLLGRLLRAGGHAVEQVAGPVADLSTCRAPADVDRVIVLHDRGDAGVARRAKAVFGAAGGRPGRLAALPLAPVEVRRRGRLVESDEATAALAHPSARFLVAATPAGDPAVVRLEAFATARIDDPLVGVRYALARIGRLPTAPRGAGLDALGDEERACLRGIGTYPDVVALAARRLEPKLVVAHVCALAAAFHRDYNRGRFLDAASDIAAARCALANGVRRVLEAALDLVLGREGERE
jgi:arginyl-tRNA synthetase